MSHEIIYVIDDEGTEYNVTRGEVVKPKRKPAEIPPPPKPLSAQHPPSGRGYMGDDLTWPGFGRIVVFCVVVGGIVLDAVILLHHFGVPL